MPSWQFAPRADAPRSASRRAGSAGDSGQSSRLTRSGSDDGAADLLERAARACSSAMRLEEQGIDAGVGQGLGLLAVGVGAVGRPSGRSSRGRTGRGPPPRGRVRRRDG